MSNVVVLVVGGACGKVAAMQETLTNKNTPAWGVLLQRKILMSSRDIRIPRRCGAVKQIPHEIGKQNGKVNES